MNLWFAAHILMVVKRKNSNDSKISAWENIVLIKAESEEAAFAKAHERGKQDEGDDDGTFLWGGRPCDAYVAKTKPYRWRRNTLASKPGLRNSPSYSAGQDEQRPRRSGSRHLVVVPSASRLKFTAHPLTIRAEIF